MKIAGKWLSSSTSEKKAEPKASFEILTNPARVVPAQEKFIKFQEESRYVLGEKLIKKERKKKICICVELYNMIRLCNSSILVNYV